MPRIIALKYRLESNKSIPITIMHVNPMQKPTRIASLSKMQATVEDMSTPNSVAKIATTTPVIALTDSPSLENAELGISLNRYFLLLPSRLREILQLSVDRVPAHPMIRESNKTTIGNWVQKERNPEHSPDSPDSAARFVSKL
jgi:hypothetical protein